MPVTKSNQVPGTGRRRKQRGAALAAPVPAPEAVHEAPVAGPPSDAALISRLDALATTLAGLDDRTTILDHVVREAMALLPADSVVVMADAPALAEAAFPAAEGQVARALIPLAIGGRHFGALEINMKPGRNAGEADRVLMGALARQCAVALDRVTALRATHEPSVPASAVALTADAPTADAGGLRAAVDQVAADLRTLLTLARSAALPPASRINEAERLATAHLSALRAHIAALAADDPG